jgi:hypothetical protein
MKGGRDGGKREMTKFLLGLLVGLLICFLFVWFGGGKTVKKLGENLYETGKRMEVMEEKVKKEKDEVWGEMKSGVKKKILKDEKEIQKKGQ